MMNSRMEAGADVTRVQVAQTAYDLADKEYFLAKLQHAL